MISKFKFPLNNGNIYIFLWSLYFMQGILYTQGSILSQGILVILFLISLYNFFKVNTQYKLPTYFKGLNLLLIMFIIYGLIYIIGGEKIYKNGIVMGNTNYLKTILISILPIYSFYLYSLKNKITKTNIQIWSIFFIIIAISQYWFNYQKITESIVIYGSRQIEITNNVSYSFLALFPLIFFWHKKPFFQYLLLGTTMFFVISGMKRGAIITGAICTLYFLYYSLANSSRNKKISIIILCLVIIYFAVEFVENMIATSNYFNQRINDTIEGNSSGRDVLYTELTNYFLYKASAFDFIFGGGANTSIKVIGQYAHNDWLEIAVNQGLLGIIVYVIYWIYVIKTLIQTKQDTFKHSILTIFFIIYFMLTLFSMSYESMSFMATLPLGYCLAKIKRTNYYYEKNNMFN